MQFNILYEDGSLLVVEKPAGLVSFPEGNVREKTLMDYLVEKYPELKDVGEKPRYGMVHRLDKDTSGIIVVAKQEEALIFLQKQFKNRGVEKKYTALATGLFKEDFGTIDSFIGRSPADPRKQKAYQATEKKPESAREALTEYKVTQRFQEYTLLDVVIKTGRKHQIKIGRAHV